MAALQRYLKKPNIFWLTSKRCLRHDVSCVRNDARRHSERIDTLRRPGDSPYVKFFNIKTKS
jgi:hypothetical protein